MWLAAFGGGLAGASAVYGGRVIRGRWRLAREVARVAGLELGDTVWARGLHDLHCREDRCSYGCGCPCHLKG